MTGARFIEGVGAVAADFDAFIVDQWGVLHDGRRPYPGAAEALKRLKAAGRTVAILSNSGRRAAVNAARLAHFGFPPALYDHLVTSGEAAWERLKRRNGAPWDRLGRRALLVSRDGDRGLLEETGIEPVEDAARADFVLLAGGRNGFMRLEDYADLLAAARARNLFMVCANPDRASIGADGVLEIGPGAVAEAYEAAGGRVHFIGKPWPEIYDLCLGRLQGFSPSRILAVGDSLAHDARGARAKGLAAMLVATGVSAPSFAGAEGAERLMSRLEPLAAAEGIWPDLLAPSFRW